MATFGNVPRVVSVADTVVQPGEITIGGFRWTAPAFGGDTVTVQDDAGHIIWSATTSGANIDQVEHFPRPRRYPGHKVSQITSGILFIYRE